MTETVSFEASGVELHMRADPAGVVILVQFSMGLAGLGKTITLPVELADRLCDELARAINRSRDMQRSIAR